MMVRSMGNAGLRAKLEQIQQAQSLAWKLL